jgi:oligopeptide transport system substrate-binding protein
MISPRALASAALLAAVALLSACSNNPHPPPLREKRADGSPWRVRYGAMSEDVRSLDPQVSYDQMGHIVLETVCDTLLQYSLFDIDPYKLEPCLLEAMPQRVDHADGTVTYECRLKPGILYHDDPCFPAGKGRELTTADVDYTWKRLCDPVVECPVFSTLQEFVVGMGEAFEAAKKSGSFDYSAPMRGLEVVDRYAFKVHLKKPYPQIQYWMAMQFLSPTPREAVEYYDGKEHPDGPGGKMVRRELFKWHPVTTGPFRIAEYRRGQMFRFIRNENYRTTTFPTSGWPAEREAEFRPLAGAQLPLVDEAQLTIFREVYSSWLLTRQGYLDGGTVNKDAFNSAITPTRELTPEYKAKGMTLNRRVDLSSFWISMNLQDPLLGSNKKLRQALSAAFDAQTWVDIFYSGVPVVAHQFVPPGIFGHQKEFRNPYAYNLDKARRLIAEAGYPNGIDPKTGRPLELTIDASGGGSWERQSVEFEQRNLEQLGIRVRVNENTFARQTEKLDQGNFQLASAGWGADYPDPENFLFLLYSKNFPPAGSNHTRFANPEFDRLFEQMATMENTPERLEIVHRLNAIVAEECPVIFNFHRAFYTVVQPWTPRTVNNEMLEAGLKYAQVLPEIREQKREEWNRKPLWPVALGALGIAGLVGYGVRWSRRQNA